MIEVYPSRLIKCEKLRILFGCYHSVTYNDLVLLTGLSKAHIILMVREFVKIGLVKKDINPRNKTRKIYQQGRGSTHFIATYHGRKVIEYSYKMLEHEKKAKLGDDHGL